jgi:hypothetical protein
LNLENHKEPDVPVKVKFQSYDHKSKDDILTYLSEFEAVAKQAKWTKEVKVLQLTISIFTVCLLAVFLAAPLVFFGGPITSVS